jgi:hypothetical protein
MLRLEELKEYQRTRGGLPPGARPPAEGRSDGQAPPEGASAPPEREG